jgi:hypothetical protein
MKSSPSTRVVIDRIEGDLAVLALYDDDRVKFNLPIGCLPRGSREGDHFQMSFDEDEESRDKERRRVDDLLKELKNR